MADAAAVEDAIRDSSATPSTPESRGPDGGSPKETLGKCVGVTGADADPDGALSGGALAQGLMAYYPCELASGYTLPDQSGNKRHATLVSGIGGGTAGYRFSTGRVGKALYLTIAGGGHVVLPAGLLADACEVTIATWVYLNSQNPWQRIWTFSPGGPYYMYLTSPNGANGVLRAGITLNANDPEDQQFVDAPSAVPTGIWTHVAVVMGPTGLALYVDGVQVAMNASATLRPADMGVIQYGYIGRSNYLWDPYFDGNIDEFRIYNRALAPAEIQALASGQ